MLLPTTFKTIVKNNKTSWKAIKYNYVLSYSYVHINAKFDIKYVHNIKTQIKIRHYYKTIYFD